MSAVIHHPEIHGLEPLQDFEVYGLPRPYIVEAVYANGQRSVIPGWLVEQRETIEQAVTRTAIEMGAVRAEIEILPL
jgi:glycerol-3-phosphate responsive antiterminator